MPGNYDQNIERLIGLEPGYGPAMGNLEVIVKYSGDLSRLEAELGADIAFIYRFRK